jgi:hypothetical protein
MDKEKTILSIAFLIFSIFIFIWIFNIFSQYPKLNVDINNPDIIIDGLISQALIIFYAGLLTLIWLLLLAVYLKLVLKEW